MIRSVFLILGTIFGALYVIVVPPLQSPDEFAHLNRAYAVAQGHCIAPAITAIPTSIKSMEAAFPPKMEAQRLIIPGDILHFMRMPLDESRYEATPNEVANTYSCFPYLPGAVGIEVGRILRAPPAAILFLNRFAGLIAYLAVVWFALGLLPDFQVPVLALALTPMALSEAASASWDGVAYATAFFLCAYILNLAWNPAIQTLQLRHYVILGVTVVLASFCKTDACLSPLLLFVPASKFQGSRRKWVVVLSAILLPALLIAGWNFLNRENMAIYAQHLRDTRQIELTENAQFVSRHLAIFFRATAWTIAAGWKELASQFVGKLGWLAVTLPGWCVWLYVILLAATGLTGLTQPRLRIAHRLICLAIAGVGVLSVFFAMWCAEGTPTYRQYILRDAQFIPGIQGRYFIPFAFPLLLAFSIHGLPVNRKRLVVAMALIAALVNAVAIGRTVGTYYLTVPASTYYNNKLVKQSGSEGDGKVYIVQSGQRRWIMNASWIASHGYRWPDDVIAISGEQLASIPEGLAVPEK